jgi:hypothetical protein
MGPVTMNQSEVQQPVTDPDPESKIRAAFDVAGASGLLAGIDRTIGGRFLIRIRHDGLGGFGKLTSLLQASVDAMNSVPEMFEFDINDDAIKNCFSSGVGSIKLYGSELRVVRKRKIWEVTLPGIYFSFRSKSLFEALLQAGFAASQRKQIQLWIAAGAPQLGVEYYKALVEDYKWILATVSAIWVTALAGYSTKPEVAQFVAQLSAPLIGTGLAALFAIALRVWHTLAKFIIARAKNDSNTFMQMVSEEESRWLKASRWILNHGHWIQLALWFVSVAFLLISFAVGLVKFFRSTLILR